MIINLSSQGNRQDRLAVTKHGGALTINGTTLDLSVIPDGATLPADAVDCEYVVDKIERIDGVLHLTLLLPYYSLPQPQGVLFPGPIVSPTDGELELPYDD